jgi:hypothetical protein
LITTTTEPSKETIGPLVFIIKQDVKAVNKKMKYKNQAKVTIEVGKYRQWKTLERWKDSHKYCWANEN